MPLGSEDREIDLCRNRVGLELCLKRGPTTLERPRRCGLPIPAGK